MPYSPPLNLTPKLVDLVSRISEAVGLWEGIEVRLSPKLRRANRIRSIHSSLAIENNTRIEFIHPFSDGNGRMGRFWQTLVLSRWRPRLAFLPIFVMTQADSPRSPTQRYRLAAVRSH